jgi:hypothetical protein
VQREKPLPVKARRERLSAKNPPRPPQSQEKPTGVLLPDLQGVAPDKPVTLPYDDEACIEFACAIIKQAYLDVNLEPKYKSRHKNEEVIYDQSTALHFLRSPLFLALCRTLRLPADKIKRRALQ